MENTFSAANVESPVRSSEHAYSLTIWEWLVLLSKAIRITFRLLLKTAKALSSRRKSGLTLYQYIAYEGMRDYQTGLNAISIQNLLPRTSKTCKRFSKKHGIARSEIRLPDGTIAHWLGPRKASKVIVFFHGGGYSCPALSQHMSFAFGFSKPSRNDRAVVVLPYDLAAENANPYPHQLQQAVSLMEYLLLSENILPSAITLLGDSAGAHLMLGLMLHLGHPNPLISPLKIEGKFCDAILVSPWVAIDADHTSAEPTQVEKRNDVLSAAALAYWAQNFLGGAALDFWNAPLTAPAEWWGDVPVDDILVTYGDDELIRDDTSKLCERLKAYHAKTTARRFSNEVHCHMILNRFLRINAPCGSEEVFVKWMNDHSPRKEENFVSIL